jgi:Tfp pilus assembly protein PilF
LRSLSDALAEEELLLERARRESVSSPAAALELLQQHEQKFPRGQLGAERMFLRVDVLKRLGNSAAAQRQAEVLIRQYPRSVYAAQLKAKQPAD